MVGPGWRHNGKSYNSPNEVIDELTQKLETVKADAEKMRQNYVVLVQEAARVRDVALLQVRDLEGVIAGALAVLRDSSLPDAKAAAQVGKILDASVSRMGLFEKRKDPCAHVSWYADPGRGPGSFCRNCDKVWLPGEDPGQKES